MMPPNSQDAIITTLTIDLLEAILLERPNLQALDLSHNGELLGYSFSPALTRPIASSLNDVAKQRYRRSVCPGPPRPAPPPDELGCLLQPAFRHFGHS
jgi:hypothetical protein